MTVDYSKYDESYFTLEEIIKRKNAARIEKANLPFAEKVAIVERMKVGLAPIHELRRQWQQENGIINNSE